MTRREILEILHFREILKAVGRTHIEQGEKLCKDGDRPNLTAEAKPAEN